MSIKELDSPTKTVTETNSGYYPKWVVIFHNDDKTTFQFVVMVLMKYFNKNQDAAIKLAELIHKQGSGVVGAYPKEQAEFRVDQTLKLARSYGFPLKATVEEG